MMGVWTMPRHRRPPGPGGRWFLSEEDKQNRPKITAQLLKRIFSYLLPYWKQLAVVIITIFVSSILSVYPTLLTGRIIDEGLIGKDFRILVILIFVSFVVMIAANLVGVLQTYVNTWIAQHIIFDMRNNMFALQECHTLLYNKQTG